ncbi:YdeI/OmpD-associated family protein [Alteromonas ponticola]|uniref:YdeI/OmpD-associated family protein n=1 Tax=Alteromonas ponticola TaxID=2720613 RepID=A0ABX1R2N3_9ALTE|nr:YdeI/OmpD-associated family protein [Alteromonas ponticola]NMH60725.1 YdeI/OmpD-associated family protein [Alteromonas ponticola]
MITNNVPAGVVHDLPDDICRELTNHTTAMSIWCDITPLARNEWICWVEDAKKEITRSKRVARLVSDLQNGKRRPCCWPGCPHR